MGPKGGISIFVDNGPLGCYHYFCASHWRGFLTFIKIVLGHTVTYEAARSCAQHKKRDLHQLRRR